MAVNMMPELMSKHGFNLIIAVILQEGIGQNDAPRVAQSRQSSIGLFSLLRQLPLVDAADPRTGALTEADKACLQLVILERRKLIEKRKQNHRSNLSKENEHAAKDQPRIYPPLLSRSLDQGVNDLAKRRCQNQTQKPAFGFIFQPGRKPRIGFEHYIFCWTGRIVL